MAGAKSRRKASSHDVEKARHRLLRFLSGGPASPRPSAAAGSVLLDGGDRGVVAARHEDLQAMARDRLIVQAETAVSLSPSGEAMLRRVLSPQDPHRAQHADIVPQSIMGEDGPETVAVNLAESPLAQLARRRAKDGRPFLAESEQRAGERLRIDYSRARIMPRLGANWEAAVSSGRRVAGAGSLAELTDAVLAARQRVERAIAAVGPELSGVLIDVCCFLKGLETVEIERGWPARSAKVMLKSALAALSRHYEPAPARRRSGNMLHWGAEDYRPKVNPG